MSLCVSRAITRSWIVRAFCTSAASPAPLWPLATVWSERTAAITTAIRVTTLAAGRRNIKDEEGITALSAIPTAGRDVAGCLVLNQQTSRPRRESQSRQSFFPVNLCGLGALAELYS